MKCLDTKSTFKLHYKCNIISNVTTYRWSENQTVNNDNVVKKCLCEIFCAKNCNFSLW